MDTRIYRWGWLGVTVALNGMVIVLWIGTLLGYAGMQPLLPYQMNWFSVFPYLLAMLLCIPRFPRLLGFGIAGVNIYFCILYVFALWRLASGHDPESMSPVWSLVVLGAGTTALNAGYGFFLNRHARAAGGGKDPAKAA